MKITMTFLIRNEEDIIRQNILFHHAQGVDSFIVMDNLSIDGTASIVKELSKEIRIDYIHQPQDDYSQSEWVTEMARRAYTDHRADWVINNDADEFWVFDGKSAKEFVQSFGVSIGIIRLRRHNAILRLNGRAPELTRSHPETSEMFERESKNNVGLSLPRKCVHRASKYVRVSQGNHSIDGVEGRVVDLDEGAYILHYPYRSLEQYKHKIRLGGAAYNRNDKLAQSVGETWREHYKLLEKGAINGFWRSLARQDRDVFIDLAEGRAFRSTIVKDALRLQKPRRNTDGLNVMLNELRESTRDVVDSFVNSQVGFVIQKSREERKNRPLYRNLDFCLRGPLQHLEKVEQVTAWEGVDNICDNFPRLRDIFSLFPKNAAFVKFLGRLLAARNQMAVTRLHRDCLNKPVIMHVSCAGRTHLAEKSVSSFDDLGNGYHHIIVRGEAGWRAEDNVDLSLDYDGRNLIVPVPDDYENLHRKIFYALTLMHLASGASCVIKIDDDLHLGDSKKFSSTISSLISNRTEYAGRLVGGLTHDTQWHGWHLNKCNDTLIEERGYQYPLPREYAAGGYGYFLGKQGVSACAYMYLAMKEFFSMRAVGLEDAYVGHALYAQGMDLHNVSSEENLLYFPGLTLSSV